MLGFRRLLQRWRRFALILRLRLQAIRTRSTLELNLAKTCRIDRGVRIFLQGGHNKITLGDRARLGKGVEIELRGGELYLGEHCEIRAETVAHISGRLYLERKCGLSIRCVIHCGSSIEIGRFTIFGEYCTIMDGQHVHVATDDYSFYGDPQAENVLKPVKIGKGAYIGAKTTIIMGVEIGDYCRVGANSLVTRSIEPHRLAVGVPARPIMKLD